VVRIHSCPFPTRSEFYRFFFPPRLFAERDFDEPPDFFLRVLLRRDFATLDLFPREAAPFVFLPFDLARADAFERLPPFLVARFTPPRFFEADDFFLLRAFGLALGATALTAFLAAGATELLVAARPASAPITPPTTAPTGPATLPRTAPVAAPATSLEIGGIWMLSDDEADASLDC
jgi:hypothetical protein